MSPTLATRIRRLLGRVQHGRLRLMSLLVLTVVMTVVGGSLLPASGEPGSGDADAPPTSAPADASGTTHTITLLTGDVVVLHIGTDGRQAAWVDQPATREPGSREPHIYERNGEVHVVPAEAEPYLSAGVLDERLFNVTYLAEQGYDDTARADLPLVVAAPGGDTVRSAPVAPASTHTERVLPSIGAVSVTADKTRLREVWESLRGPDAAALSATDATLAGAGKVWLNGRVHATLDESVAQIGAPEVWAAGFDGAGVPVAVLDTGHDPHHPDLAGKVSAAHNFTDDPDPEGETAVDGNGHGTHVAATVAGTGAASDGARSGVAPGADLMIGKVLDSEGSGYEDWIIAGMEWAVDEGARVVNLSLGTPGSSDGTDPMSVAVDRLTDSSGAIFVVAAGNSGPFPEAIGSPGAATRALTVGAVTKADEPASFSSRGPRWGDGAIKPEVVAPGVGIVAARAAGTSLGDLIDENYTSLNGTSMATPHVAGAAAILAQQHPDWTADEIKARLISTSLTLEGQPLSFQGAGRIDVPAATGASATVSDGAVSFGRVAQGSGSLTHSLTYTNPTDRRITLRLSADVESAGGTRALVRFSRSTLVVPAGGTASTDVTISTRRLAGGDYSGYVNARDLRDRSKVVRTVMSLGIDAPLRTVTVSAVGRDGKPAGGRVELWNTDTGRPEYAFFDESGVASAQVPEGPYTVMTSIETLGGSDWRPLSHTVAGEPELTISRDLSLSYDARKGQPIAVETPREADVDSYRVSWRRTVGDTSITSIMTDGLANEPLYTLTSSRVRKGEFELSTTWQLQQPLLTAQITGGERVQPSPALASEAQPYVGSASLPVVDAGQGTPEEFAQVDVAGKIALVVRRGEFELAAQLEAAKDAGAALVLAYNYLPGTWTETVWNAPLPAYTLDAAAGAQLQQAIAAGAPTLDLVGLQDATYLYELAYTENRRIPTGRTYDAADHPMATVESDYRQDSERMASREWYIPYAGSAVLGSGVSFTRNGPVTRTEYVSVDDVQWQRFGQPHGEFANMYWTWTGARQYEDGETDHQLWWGPLTRPGVPDLSGRELVGSPVARFRDAIRIAMPHYLYGTGAAYGYIQEQLGDVSELTLSRDGELVGTATWPEAQFTVPAADAEYELALNVTNGSGNFADTSVHTETTWRFRSARTDEDRTVLPLVQVGYELAAGPYNDVPAGAPYPLVLRPGYQPGASGPGEFTTTVEVSYDDGATWADVPVETDADTATATLPAAPAAGFATVRVVVTDSAGNALTQRIDRAWRIAEE